MELLIIAKPMYLYWFFNTVAKHSTKSGGVAGKMQLVRIAENPVDVFEPEESKKSWGFRHGRTECTRTSYGSAPTISNGVENIHTKTEENVMNKLECRQKFSYFNQH